MSQIIQVRRKTLTDKATFGEMYGPDGSFWAHTMEDVCRNVKIKGSTAIPAGVFELIVGWSDRYKRLMPRLLNVPFFDGILIHPGNDTEDTAGCILVGDDDPRTKDLLDSSRKAFDRIFPSIRKLAEHGHLCIRIEGGFEAEYWGKPVDSESVPVA